MRKLSPDVEAAWKVLAPNIAWYLSPNQMERLSTLLSEENPKCSQAGQDLYCNIAELLQRHEG